MTAKVRTLKETYGFLELLEIGEDGKRKSYFFHQNETKDFRGLRVGDIVEFELGKGLKNDVVAVSVKRVEKGIEEILEEEAGEEAEETE